MKLKISKEQKLINKIAWQENKNEIFKLIAYYYDLGWRYNCIAVILNLKNFKTSTGNGWYESNVIYVATKIIKLPERLIRRSDFNESQNNILDLLDLFKRVQI